MKIPKEFWEEFKKKLEDILFLLESQSTTKESTIFQLLVLESHYIELISKTQPKIIRETLISFVKAEIKNARTNLST